jgi:hypothetical protein
MNFHKEESRVDAKFLVLELHVVTHEQEKEDRRAFWQLCA